MSIGNGLRVLTDHRCLLGEGPWWSVKQHRLYWVDITGRAVHRSALDGTSYRRWEVPSEIGFLVLARDGGGVMGLRDGLHRLDFDTGEIVSLLPLEQDRPHQRFNDGKCDRQGRLWFGSMRDEPGDPVGALYRYDGGPGATLVFGEVHTSNGLGWSPDGSRMYYTDSPRHRIDVLDFDQATGAVSNRRTFADDPAGVLPDGLTVDSEGCVWSAKWDGSAVVRYTPGGDVDRLVEMPVARPTSCMFAGPDLRTLVVTSALDGPGVTSARPELAGATFLLGVDVPGLPEAHFTPR
jgi:L-arabinonolactonase